MDTMVDFFGMMFSFMVVVAIAAGAVALFNWFDNMQCKHMWFRDKITFFPILICKLLGLVFPVFKHYEWVLNDYVVYGLR